MFISKRIIILGEEEVGEQTHTISETENQEILELSPITSNASAVSSKSQASSSHLVQSSISMETSGHR